MKIQTIILWIARIIAAVIMLQTLYFKFSGSPESVELFTQLHAEPWGRIGTGIMELIASILILLPSTVWLGSFLSLGLMAGAIASHLLVIGIMRNDGGQLFWYAVTVLVCALYSVVVSRTQAPTFVKKILPSLFQN